MVVRTGNTPLVGEAAAVFHGQRVLVEVSQSDHHPIVRGEQRREGKGQTLTFGATRRWEPAR